MSEFSLRPKNVAGNAGFVGSWVDVPDGPDETSAGMVGEIDALWHLPVRMVTREDGYVGLYTRGLMSRFADEGNSYGVGGGIQFTGAQFPEAPDFLEKGSSEGWALQVGYGREMGHQEAPLRRNRLEFGLKAFWTVFDVGVSGAALVSGGLSTDEKGPMMLRFMLMGRHNIL